MPQVSPNLLKRARELRAQRWSWNDIGRDLGIGAYRIRCELEHGYRKHCIENVQRNRLGRGPRLPRTPRPSNAVGHSAASVVVPADVIADRERRALIEPVSLTAALMGDPPLGRSALDMRKPRLVTSNQDAGASRA